MVQPRLSFCMTAPAHLLSWLEEGNLACLKTCQVHEDSVRLARGGPFPASQNRSAESGQCSQRPTDEPPRSRHGPYQCEARPHRAQDEPHRSRKGGHQHPHPQCYRSRQTPNRPHPWCYQSRQTLRKLQEMGSRQHRALKLSREDKSTDHRRAARQ